jgi:hypothetical protein
MNFKLASFLCCTVIIGMACALIYQWRYHVLARLLLRFPLMGMHVDLVQIVLEHLNLNERVLAS